MPGLTLCLRRAALLPILCASALVAAKAKEDHGLRFDDPRVLDLASWTLKFDAGKALAFGKLDAATALAIMKAPAISEETPLQLPFSEDQFDCKDDAACMKAHEAKLIAQADGSVRRIDKRLVIAGAGQPVILADWVQPQAPNAEGEHETHWYLGRMAGNGYHRVEVQFGHDAPGDFLINSKNGKVAFVHNGADIVRLSADGKYVFTFNTLNPPLTLRVARLDDSGPALVLMCQARARDDKTSGEFRDWSSANAFDFIVHVGGVAQDQDVQLRLTHGDGGWSGAASDADKLTAAGFVCKAL